MEDVTAHRNWLLDNEYYNGRWYLAGLPSRIFAIAGPDPEF